MGVELSLTFLTNFTAAQQEHINLAFPAGLAPDTFAYELAWCRGDWFHLVEDNEHVSIPSTWALEQMEYVLTQVDDPDDVEILEGVVSKLKELIPVYPASSVTYAFHG